MKTPRVSFITINFNGARYIKECINSVLSQTFEAWEHIIVDCGSTDNSLMILEQVCHDKLKIIKIGTCGLSFARNMAIHHAKGEYCAILDIDDEAMPVRLSSQLNVFENNKSVVAVGGNAIIRYAENKQLRKYLQDNKMQRFPISHQEILVYCFACLNPLAHSNLTFRKDAFTNVGGYLENQERAEDFDIILRLGLYGQIVGINQIVGVIRYARPGSYGYRQVPGVRNSEYFCCRSILMSSITDENRERKSVAVNIWLDKIGQTGIKALQGKWIMGQLILSNNNLGVYTCLKFVKALLPKIPAMFACMNKAWMWGSHKPEKIVTNYIDQDFINT